ncbi:MAG: hypothetical protein IKQ62_03405 [Bacteroidaceae bacterium]|nr:hypothetical protein [Bacteroidaceae bacterium]
MKKKDILSFLFMGWTAIAVAQSSTICHDDGTVTFQYRNDHAKEVMVDVQFAGRHAMQRDAQTGLWTATLGPAAPDMYPYCFIVDGMSVMDPENDQYFPNEGFKNSILEIPNPKGSLPHDIKDVPHGKVEYIHYYSQSLKGTNNAIVYLPPAYEEQKNANKRYPVFYLISGTTDTEEVYYKVGRVNYILDNLLAEGNAEEMIVVLPYGNPQKLLVGSDSPATSQPQTRFGGDVFSNDLTADLMPYVEQHYRTLNDRDHRAIGGFSRGGNQGLSNGLRNLDKFSYLCSYSSFTSTDIPGVYDNAADTNSKLHLFWLGVGTDDFLYGNARDYMEFLDKKGIRSVKEYTHDKFGHTWMNAKYFLEKTLRLLFRPEAAEAAMQNAQPALAATGKEKQFTPAVMAQLFPRANVSPEYKNDGVTFRINAPAAKQVLLEREWVPEPIAMEKDSDGVWSLDMKGVENLTFKYCFIVDGTKVADPTNMFLSPDKGFKYSIHENPASKYSLLSMGDIPHGKVTYDLNKNTATYYPPTTKNVDELPVILLIPGDDDTMESWFKVGGANAIADKMLAEGKTIPYILTTDTSLKDRAVVVMPASINKTWSSRRIALEQVLLR